MYSTGWGLGWVDMIWMSHHVAELLSQFCQIQSAQAGSGTNKIKVNATQVSQEMPHPVLPSPQSQDIIFKVSSGHNWCGTVDFTSCLGTTETQISFVRLCAKLNQPDMGKIKLYDINYQVEIGMRIQKTANYYTIISVPLLFCHLEGSAKAGRSGFGNLIHVKGVNNSN